MTYPGLLAPPAVADAPPRTVAPHGLLETTLEVVESTEMRGQMEVEPWAAGFEFQPESCEDGGMWVPCVDEKPGELNPGGSGSGDVEQVKSEGDAPAPVLFIPYTVEGQFTCGTRGFQVADYPGRARRQLERIQGKQIEHEFWTGAQMSVHPTGEGNQSLVSADSTLLSGTVDAPTAVSPRVALSLISQGVANCAGGVRAVIHATPYLAELWGTGYMIREEGSRLVSMTRGNWIVSGAGYPGTGPIAVGEATGGEAGQPHVPGANEVWVFATGMVNWRLGRVRLYPGEDEIASTLAQAMRPSSSSNGGGHGWDNQIQYRAERPAAAVFDPCCVLAVLVDLTLGVC